MVIIVPKHHPLTKQEKVSVADTLLYPKVWFSKRSGIRAVVESIYKKEKNKATIAFEVSEDETVAGLVGQGFGLAMIPRLDFLDKLEDIEIIEIESLKKQRLYYAAYPNDRKLSAELEDFISFIKKESLDLKDIN